MKEVLKQAVSDQETMKRILKDKVIILGNYSKVDMLRMGYLLALTEYSIWADSLYDGDAICDKLNEELKILLNQKKVINVSSDYCPLCNIYGDNIKIVK